MTDIKKEKVVRTARQPESITKGALKLTLKERVALVNTLKASINNELKEIENSAQEAKEIVNGL